MNLLYIEYLMLFGLTLLSVSIVGLLFAPRHNRTLSLVIGIIGVLLLTVSVAYHESSSNDRAGEFKLLLGESNK